MIGIDLGTTYSCVGIANEDKLQMVNLDGKRTIPSVVAFEHNAASLCGVAAKDMLESEPTNVIYDIKRMIGRRFCIYY